MNFFAKEMDSLFSEVGYQDSTLAAKDVAGAFKKMNSQVKLKILTPL